MPDFRQFDWCDNRNRKYDHPDTNKGEKWLTNKPKAEQKAMKDRNDESNGLLFDTCRHMREIRSIHFSSYHLPGIVIDSYEYHYIVGWHWLRDGEQSAGQPSGTYEKKLNNDCPLWLFNLKAPESGMNIVC